MKRLAGLMTGLLVALAAIDHRTCPEPTEVQSEEGDLSKVEVGDDADDDAADDWVPDEAGLTAAVNGIVAHQEEEASFARGHAAEVSFPPWRLGSVVRS